MIPLLVAAAWAEPVVLRQPAAPVVASIGPADQVVGAWIGPLGLALDLHGGASLGVSAGTSWELTRGQTGFGARVALAGGLALPWLDPGLVVTVTPALLAGWQREGGSFEIGLVSPAAVRVAPGQDGRLPLLAELQGSHRWGPVRVGAHLGLGEAWSYLSPAEITWSGGIDGGWWF